MNTTKKVSIVIGLILSLNTSILAQYNQDTTAHYMSQFKKDLEFIIGDKPYMGGAITVYKNGQYWSTSSGIKTEGMSANHEDRFIFRSFTKTLLATVIMQLQEKDSLNIDNPYVDYIEPVTYVDTTLTLRELLSMKANTCEYISNTWEIIDQDPTAVHDVRYILEQTIPDDSCNENKEVKYTNTNYMVLGLVMEEILGKSGEQIFQDRFIEDNEFKGLLYTTQQYYPWVVEDGIFELAPINIDPNSLNGVWTDNNGTPNDQFGKSLNAVLTAQKYAGSVVSTTEQSLRLLNAILTPGVLLSQESLDEMQVFQTNYGLGLMSYDLNEYIVEDIPIKIVGHFGAGLNSTATFMFPEYNYGISIALNMTRSNQWDTFLDGIYNLIYNFSYLLYCEQGGGCADIKAPNPLEGRITKSISHVIGSYIDFEFMNWDGETDTLQFGFDNNTRIVNSEGNELNISDVDFSKYSATLEWEWNDTTSNYIVNKLILDGVTTSNEQQTEIKETYSLSQNYPNPFNPSTSITFELPQPGLVELKVYNLLGQEVANLVDGRMNSGNHTVNFDASQLSSGVYIYRLVAGNQSITKKMMLIK